MRALFVWATWSVRQSKYLMTWLVMRGLSSVWQEEDVMIIDSHCLPPPKSTGEKGDPVATNARPSVQAIASSGSTSHSGVGLDMGNCDCQRTIHYLRSLCYAGPSALLASREYVQ